VQAYNCFEEDRRAPDWGQRGKARQAETSVQFYTKVKPKIRNLKKQLLLAVLYQKTKWVTAW